MIFIVDRYFGSNAFWRMLNRVPPFFSRETTPSSQSHVSRSQESCIDLDLLPSFFPSFRPYFLPSFLPSFLPGPTGCHLVP